MKKVTKEEFDKFIENYPRKLEYSVLTICSPEKGQYNDFTLGVWPKSVVASFNLWGHNPKDAKDIWGKEPCNWFIKEQTQITKQKQAYLHDPENGIYGDCYRTAIACILNIDKEKVPHLAKEYDNDIDGWDREMKKFLNSLGYTLVDIPFVGIGTKLPSLLESLGRHSAEAVYILAGESSNGTNHCVVCKGGEIIWDPAIDDSGIIGPCNDQFFWVTYIVPLRIEVDI